jgi:hypothetical protein
MRKILLASFLNFCLCSSIPAETAVPQAISPINPKVIQWLKSNISPVTQLPYSFYVPVELKSQVYANMGGANAVPGIIERMITHEGLDIYDGAVYQIVLAMLGDEESLAQASKPIEIYWKGAVGELHNIRAGYPENLFIYNPQAPESVTSDISAYGRRGFIFRILNADGKYLSADPLDGKEELAEFPNYSRLHWEDWKPVAGENAWVTMAALHVYHKKYYDPVLGYLHNDESEELALAKELARAAILLQSSIGGVRMAPLGTYREMSPEEKATWEEGSWWYHQISTENNISWYSAFRMLYEITGNSEYQLAMTRIEDYMRFVWDKEQGIFHQGANFTNGQWALNKEHFALDVQTWAMVCFGAETIDRWFGEGAAFNIWQSSRQRAGVFDAEQNLLGVGYTEEHDRISVEWSAGAIMALQDLIGYYQDRDPVIVREVSQNMKSMRLGMETLLKDISETQSAYSYSSRRGWIPFGWNSHDPNVLSLASTGWMVFVDAQFNPFRLRP